MVRAISDGGLTPPLALVEAIARETTLPLRVMVRENAGFETTPAELEVMRRAAANLAALGVDGLVTGFAKQGQIWLDPLQAVVEAAPRLAVTFHRAFDTLSDPLRAVHTLSGIAQVDGILTSGGEGPVAERCARFREYTARAGPRVAIIAGGGVDVEAFEWFVSAGCVRQLHVGRAAREGNHAEGPVSAASVRRLRDLADVKSRISP